MTTGLIGSTGFVGGTVMQQRHVDAKYHRPNVHEIRGATFTRLWIAAAPAAKWVANDDPRGDAEGLRVLAHHLRHVAAEEVVLFSTVDVYPDPRAVDESTEVHLDDHVEAYGRNRLWLERAVRAIFPEALVMRLPGLFGRGLRKNLVYDLLQERQEFAHKESIFQFYDMRRLCADADKAIQAGLLTVNLATEPVSAQTVAQRVFGRELLRDVGRPAAYDMWTRHADLFGRAGSRYVEGVDGVLSAMSAFVAAEAKRA